MAKKATKAAKATKATKAARKTAARKKTNVEILVEKGALDAGAAARLDRDVVKKINEYKKRDVDFLIDHQLKVCGVARPAPDGSFF